MQKNKSNMRNQFWIKFLLFASLESIAGVLYSRIENGVPWSERVGQGTAHGIMVSIYS